MAQTNWDDPRIQKAVAKKMANSKKAVQELEYQGLYSDFAKQQMGVQLQFQQMALQEKIHEDNLGLQEQRLAFNQWQFNQNYKMRQDQLRSDRTGLKVGLIGGLATSLLAGYYGHERKVKQAEINKQQKKRNEALDKYLGIGE